MNLTAYATNYYDNKSDHLAMTKQSQNKPNQSQFMVSEVEPSCPERSRGIYQNNYPPPAEIAYSS
jgi:hypothetical protein